MAGYSLDQNLGLRFHHIRRASLPTMFALMLLSTAAALAQVSGLPEPVVTWAGERPAFVRATYFADDPWGEPLRSRGGPEAERWGFYVWSGPPLWLVVEVDGAPEGARLCVVWPDPNGEPAAESCQVLPGGPARPRFMVPRIGTGRPVGTSPA